MKRGIAAAHRVKLRVAVLRLPARSVATTRIVWRAARNRPALIRTENRVRVVRLIRLPSRKTSTLRSPDASLTLTRAVKPRLTQRVGIVRRTRGAVRSAPGVGVGVGALAHRERVMVLVSNVTAAFRASTLPSTVAPVVAVIDVKARMDPLKVEAVPSVAELPTCQKTLQAWAPLTRFTLLADAVVSVEPAWKMKTAFALPWASSVSAPGQPQRGRGPIDAGRQPLAAEVRGHGAGRGLRSGIVVRGGQVGLRLGCDRVGYVLRAVHRSGRKARHRSAWTQPKIPIDHGRTCVRDRRASQNRERFGRAKGYRRRRPRAARERQRHRHRQQQQPHTARPRGSGDQAQP